MNTESKQFYSTSKFSSSIIFSNKIGLNHYNDMEMREGDFKNIVRVVCPLSYFNYKVNVDIANLKTLNIEKISNDFVGYEEWSKLYRTTVNWSDFAFVSYKEYVGLDRLKTGDHVGKYCFRGDELIMPSPPKEFDILLLALRLYKFEDVWCDSCLNIFNIQEKFYNLSYIGERVMGGNNNPTSGYKLQDCEISSFAKFLNYIDSHYKYFAENTRLKIALSFFESSYHCVPNHQKFTDLIIALEAMFNCDSTVEITHKMCQRVAMCFKSADRVNIFNKMKGLLSIRGKIVHGSYNSDVLSPLSDIAFCSLHGLRSIVSACLINYLKLLEYGCDDKNIVQLLDSCLLDKEKNKFIEKKIIDCYPSFKFVSA